MKSIFPIIAFLLFVNVGLSQRKAEVECGYFGKKSVEERNKVFPFDKAKKIFLIAYPNGVPHEFEERGSENKSAKDSLDYAEFGYKIEKVFKFGSSDTRMGLGIYIATKVIPLETKSIDSLSNTLFNYKLKINHYPYAVGDVKCYNPRHAVLFLDNEDKVISVLEICFECHKYYLFPSSKYVEKASGVDCDKRLDDIKDLFIRQGFEIKEH